MSYDLDLSLKEPDICSDEFALIANGDLRHSANVRCWSEQKKLEAQVISSLENAGVDSKKIKRAHNERESPDGRHGFLSSAKEGDEAFLRIHPQATVVLPASAWAYTHHFLEGLRRHKGKILIASNDSGTWPGIVFALQAGGSLRKAGINYSFAWGNGDELDSPIKQFVQTGEIPKNTDHVKFFDQELIDNGGFGTKYKEDLERGKKAADWVSKNGLRMGIFDEFCMGMYAAVIPDEALPLGVTKERLSQSALVARMDTVPKETIERHRRWLFNRKMRFVGVKGGLATLVSQGHDEANHLTEKQINRQLAMFDSAVQIADEFGCAAIGIQYQQGLKDVCPASDLTEGTLNNSERPPVYNAAGRELYAGRPVTHFNEVDEMAGLGAMLTTLAWRDLGMKPDTTLHDVRWSTPYKGPELIKEEDVHIFEISGAVPPSMNIGGWAGSVGERQPGMYFPKGGSTLKGVSKPGEIVWNRLFMEEGKLHMYIGRGGVVQLPADETQRRLDATTSEWPIANVVTYGISKKALMNSHPSNHINMVYANNAEMANRGLAYVASMAKEMGIIVHVCGDVNMTLDDIQEQRFRYGNPRVALPYFDRLSDDISLAA